MAFSSFVELFDRLAATSIMRGSTATLAGFIASICLIALLLGIYVPPAISYLQGDYYQSLFMSTANSFNKKFYSDDDFKIAMVFKDRATGAVLNHTSILEYTNAFAEYRNSQGGVAYE